MKNGVIKMVETYFCRFCEAEVVVGYAAGHIAKHFQKQEFTEKWMRSHFEDFYYVKEKSLSRFLDLEKDFDFHI